MTTGLITLKPNASVGRAYAEMKLARIRHFPVVNPDGALVGIFSSLDVMKAMGRSGLGKAIPVASLMSTRILTIREDEPASLAAKRLREKKVGALPVLDRAGKLVGIITEADFLRVAEAYLARAEKEAGRTTAAATKRKR